MSVGSLRLFLKQALRYRKIVVGGLEHGLTARRLIKDGEFKTVPRHELIVETICDTLGKLTGLDPQTQERLNITALLHDVDKKLEYRPDEFSPQAKAQLAHHIQDSPIDNGLLKAAKEQFVEQYADNVDGISLPEMLLYYADMIVSWDKIMPFHERIAESRTRRPDLPEEFFETELKFGGAIEQRIFNLLPSDTRASIGAPDQIPNYLINILVNRSA